MPVYCVGVKNQFCFDGFGIVKYKHAAAAYNHQFLLFVGIEPAYKDVRADAGGKFEVGHGDVGNPGVEEVAADGVDIGRFFSGQAQYDGNIVRGE